MDGVPEKETPWASAPAATTQDFGIGKRLGGHGGYLPFPGLIDEVQVAVLEPAPHPLLSVFRSGEDVGISWKDCGTLQTGPDLEGPWSDILRISHPHSITNAVPQGFYRLAAP